MFTISYLDKGETRTFRLASGDTIVGRAPTCGLTIDAPTVSRQHARFRLVDGKLFVSDAGSRFGTYHNGVRLEGEVQVRAGETLVLGDVHLRFELPPEDRVSVSDNRCLVEGTETLFLPVGGRGATESTRRQPAADATRLLRLLSEIGSTLIAAHTLPDVLETIVDLVFEGVPAERTFLMLCGRDDSDLQAAVARNRDGSRLQTTQISRTIVRRVIADRTAILACDAPSDPRFGDAASLTPLSMRSLMCAPLWNAGTVIGVLYVDNPWTNQFGAADLEVLAAISNYAAVAIQHARLAEQLQEETRRREFLQRYHSPAVVNRIIEVARGHDTRAVGEEHDLTVMFADIVDFSVVTERMSPPDVVALLSGFFEMMTDIVFEWEGTLDKFIGDCMMVVFGAPIDQPDHARRCVQAALAMRRALAAFNAEAAIVPLQMRVAINSGVAMAGDVGSAKRREFTVLGDVVNVAAHLERQSRPGQILISRATYERLLPGVNVTPLGPMLRSRLGAIDAFAVLD